MLGIIDFVLDFWNSGLWRDLRLCCSRLLSVRTFDLETFGPWISGLLDFGVFAWDFWTLGRWDFGSLGFCDFSTLGPQLLDFELYSNFPIS